MDNKNGDSNTIASCLSRDISEQLRASILALGDLTGLKENKGTFCGANFERAILLREIILQRKPKRVLEIGTGRGFGAFSIVRAARESGISIDLTTVDILPPEAKQRWPLRRNGKTEVAHFSRSEVWQWSELAQDSDLIQELTGATTRTLPALVAEGKTFDFIFIDAGHDLFSVIHDLAYSIKLLCKGGALLMDDFAPLEEFGLGTCLAVGHARRFFGETQVIATEGLVFGENDVGVPSRGMVFLDGCRGAEEPVSGFKLLGWRLFSKILELTHRIELFPIAR